MGKIVRLLACLLLPVSMFAFCAGCQEKPVKWDPYTPVEGVDRSDIVLGESAQMLHTKDVLADTWMATDDENRFTGAGKGDLGDKKVGIFYFLWHDVQRHKGDGQIYNHTEAWRKGGIQGVIDMIQQGPVGFAHYWAEPYFGYYRSDDEWVIRKHTYQLVAAGVDFIFIDATNGKTYQENYEAILRVWTQMRAEGYQTPQIAFHCGNSNTNAIVSFREVWRNIYSRDLYKELWFMHEGKPLILLPYETALFRLTPEQQEFFTIRHSWAFTDRAWYTDHDGKNCWPWADLYPQGPGLSPEGKMEQMVVMSGYWANSTSHVNRGRSFHNNKQPDGGDFGFKLVENGTSGKGYAFQEQFDYAIENDPGIIMVIGWNEWWAGRWEAGNAVGQLIADTYVVTDDDAWTRNYYVDGFNPEFSRDIEPVKGLYKDNYYYQMIMNLRTYKGARKVQQAFGQRPIVLTDPLSQWDIVGPEYRDYQGDTVHRNTTSYVGGLQYTNTSGRNDIVLSKVSKYDDTITFYVECAQDITAAEGTNWMNLFVDADCNHETGWYGYDYVLNRTRSEGTCSVMKFVGNEWKMKEMGTATYVVNGKTMQIQVSLDTLRVSKTFDFKWADNSVDNGDIMQFIDLGDTAPNDRFNYRYTTKKSVLPVPEEVSKDMVVLKAGSYYAYAGGEVVRLDASSTKATFFGDDQGTYVPKAFAQDVMQLNVSGEKVYNHYGIEYVNIAGILPTCGKTVSQREGLLVVADKSVSEADLLTLYRSLY